MYHRARYHTAAKLRRPKTKSPECSLRLHPSPLVKVWLSSLSIVSLLPKGENAMASLMESLGQALTPEAMSTIGNALGLDPQMVQQGVNVIGPLVQGGLANASSSPDGLNNLMQMLTPPADSTAGS